MGEYARSLAIAQGVQKRWPSAAIQFMLSREAPYAAQAPFPAVLLASSPTFHSAAVADVIERWRPDVVIFDNAGRTAQLRAAKRCGARVVYISARRRQRGKAFRLRWMRLIDEHWIAYPEFIAGALGFFERLKLDLLRRPTVRYLDVILTHDRGPPGGSIISRMGCDPDSYVLVVPGGGTGHPGANDAVAQFLSAAESLAAAGVPTVFVGRAEGVAATAEVANVFADRATVDSAAAAVPIVSLDRAEGVAAAAGAGHARAPFGGTQARGSPLWKLGSLPQGELAELMRAARLIIANGGSTLLQSIACGKPCIAVPIAGDQSERIRRCVGAGVAVAAALDSASILRTATDLLHNESQLDALAGRSIALGLADGVEVALRALNTLIPAK